jgi:hypothetical protein
MDFRIVDTFTDSLACLIGGKQKAVKTTAFDLQRNCFVDLRAHSTNRSGGALP